MNHITILTEDGKVHECLASSVCVSYKDKKKECYSTILISGNDAGAEEVGALAITSMDAVLDVMEDAGFEREKAAEAILEGVKNISDFRMSKQFLNKGEEDGYDNQN